MPPSYNKVFLRKKNLDDIRESVGLEFHREHLVEKRDLFTKRHSDWTTFSGTQMTKIVFFHGSINGREVTIILLYFANRKVN